MSPYISDENAKRDVYMYYAHENGASLEELGKKFGISRERVGQCIRRVHKVISWTAYQSAINRELESYNA